jgi:hypothetical protein
VALKVEPGLIAMDIDLGLERRYEKKPAMREGAGYLPEDLSCYRTSPGPSVPPVVGLRSSVIEMYAPIHDPEAAKQTYVQFFV